MATGVSELLFQVSLSLSFFFFSIFLCFYSGSCLWQSYKVRSAQYRNKRLFLWRAAPSSPVLLTPQTKVSKHLLPSGFLGQSIFAMNNCHDFQGLLCSFQSILIPGRILLFNTDNQEAVAVGKPNSSDISTYQVSFTVHFRVWQLEETRKGFVLFFQAHFKKHHTQPAYTVDWLKKKKVSTHITASL